MISGGFMLDNADSDAARPWKRAKYHIATAVRNTKALLRRFSDGSGSAFFVCLFWLRRYVVCVLRTQ